MNPQKDTMITKQVPEQYTKGEVSPWTLESPMTTSKTGSLSASTATNTDTWPRNAKRRKNERPEYVLNVTKKDILPEIVKESRR